MNEYTMPAGAKNDGTTGAVSGNDPLPAAQKKRRFALDRADLVFAGVLAALTLGTVAALLETGFRLGYAVGYLAVYAAASIYIGRRQKANPGAFGLLCGALAPALAVNFFLTSNPQLRLLTAAGSAVLTVVWLRRLGGRQMEKTDLGLASFALEGAASALQNAPKAVRSLLFPKEAGRKRRTGALLGVLCAIPVLLAVVPLLVSSDAAFDGMVGRLVGNPWSVFSKLLVTLLVLPFLFGFCFAHAKETEQPPRRRTARGLDAGFFTAFLAVLSVVYAAYLFSQLAYFFSAFSGLLPADYEKGYAAYARRGFFELCGVAAINLAILFCVTILCRRKENGRLPGAVKALGCFLTLFTLTLIGTALAKMRLYITQYGMTVLRVSVSVFMAVMAAVFVTLLCRLFTDRARALPVAAAALALALLLLGAGNVNGFVAKYNYEAFRAGKLAEIDVTYLRELGAEGVPYLTALCEDESLPLKLRNEAAEAMYFACRELYETESVPKTDYDAITGESWEYMDEQVKLPLRRQSENPMGANLPELRAYEAADAFLSAYPDFVRKEDRALEKGNGYFGQAQDGDADAPQEDVSAPQD